MHSINSLWTNTMNRCKSLSGVAILAAASFLSFPAQTQTSQNGVREFPKAAMRGKLVVTTPPDITMNGTPERLSPGSRIRDTQSHIVMSASIVGSEFNVNYTRDAAGLVHEVWILNAEEVKEKRPGMAPARNFFFDSDPPKIDPNTPFDKLPKYKP
jgi:hypothetical protein